jgi:hypothetical protein
MAVNEVGLPALCHFADLKRLKIVRTWTSLNRWVDERGFPPGRVIGRHRVWTARELLAWIEGQPADKIAARGCCKNGAAA